MALGSAAQLAQGGARGDTFWRFGIENLTLLLDFTPTVPWINTCSLPVVKWSARSETNIFFGFQSGRLRTGICHFFGTNGYEATRLGISIGAKVTYAGVLADGKEAHRSRRSIQL